MAPSPGIFLAAVAREMSKIRLGPLVYLLPLYNPLRLIEKICMLDHLSTGRFEVGVGRGISPIEVGFLGVDHEEADLERSDPMSKRQCAYALGGRRRAAETPDGSVNLEGLSGESWVRLRPTDVPIRCSSTLEISGMSSVRSRSGGSSMWKRRSALPRTGWKSPLRTREARGVDVLANHSRSEPRSLGPACSGTTHSPRETADKEDMDTKTGVRVLSAAQPSQRWGYRG